MTHPIYIDEEGRKHDYSTYTTEKLKKIWYFCPNREITDIIEEELEKRGVEL